MPPRNGADVDLSLVTRYTRQQFLDEVWDYKAEPDNCDHVTVLAPSGGGKTHLLFELLGVTYSSHMQPIVLVMKPRDTTVSRFAQRFKFSVVRSWPPPTLKTKLAKKPNGFVLWPLEHDDPDVTDRQQQTLFKRALRQAYRSKEAVAVVADETYSLEHELNLESELRRIWTKGRSNGCGLWAGSQRAAYISKWAYQAQHLFLGHDPDEDSQKRLGQLGAGISSDWVRAVVANLDRYEFCYINREERSMCIIGAN